MRRFLLILSVVVLCGGCGHLSFSPSASTLSSSKHREGTEQSAAQPCGQAGLSGLPDSDGDNVPDHCDECLGTPPNVAVDAFGCPIPLFVRQDLHFETSRDGSAPEFQETLQRLGQLLSRNPHTTLRLEGHTDSVGDAQRNMELSERRAASIKQALTALHDISPERIQVSAHGQSRPLVSNDTEEGRGRNRRVTLTVAGYYQNEVTHLALNKPVLLHFATAEANLDPAGNETLEQLGRLLQTNSDIWAAIEGHTDSVGHAATNLRLSEERAQAVRDMLISRYSLDPRRLVSVGYGQERPLADNATEKGRFENRRVEIHLQKGGVAGANAVRKELLSQPPGQRYTIEVSVGDCKLYLYENLADGGRRLVRSYTVATAKPGVRSPFGMGHVTKIDLDPWWHPTPNMKATARRKGSRLASVRPGSPRNPMGEFKIHLSHANAIRIHGTNRPDQIGLRVSAGCVRMRNDEGKMLAHLIDVGTEVVIRN
jgi:outer membrane protein OmpA-like peptidoglycan-associated protein